MAEKTSNSRTVSSRARELSREKKALSDLEAIGKVGIAPIVEALRIRANDELTETKLKELARKHGVDADDLVGALTLSTIFVISSIDSDEPATPPAKLVRDLLELGAINKEVSARALPVLEELVRDADLVAAIADSFSAESHIKAAFPTLSGIWTRPVAIGDFPKGEVVKVESYTPKVKGLPVAVVVQIDINEFGTMKRVSFGLSRNKLGLMVDQLTLAQRDADALRMKCAEAIK